MNDNLQSSRKLAIISVAAMGVLAVAGIVFYRQRVLFSDAAYFFFHIVNDKKLCIQEGRYGSFITQGFPYIAAKLHLPLRVAAIAFGAGFNLFFLAVSAMLVFLLKQYRLAILMALYYFLFFSESFIWVSEIPQGMAWMFLLFGITLYAGEKKSSYLLLLVPFMILAWLTLFSHFVLIIPTTFLWVYFIVEGEKWPWSRPGSVLLSAATVVVTLSKFLLSDVKSGPESKQLYGITHFSLKDIIESFTMPEVTAFFYRCLTNYWLGTITFVISIIALLRSRQRILAIWTLLSAVGYIIIMGLTYGNLDGKTLLFHIESEWTSIGIIAATGFVFAFLPRLKGSTAAWLLVGIFAVRLVYIAISVSPFTTRNDIEQQILARMKTKGITKLALIEDSTLNTATMLSWGLPYETMMMSAMNGDNPQRTFLFVSPADSSMLSRLKEPKTFNALWEARPCNTLNKDYFSIDSTTPYRVMSYAELVK